MGTCAEEERMNAARPIIQILIALLSIVGAVLTLIAL